MSMKSAKNPTRVFASASASALCLACMVTFGISLDAQGAHPRIALTIMKG